MLNPRLALRRIDNGASRSGQQALLHETRVISPEVRSLREHFYRIGVEDEQRVNRLDPSQHFPTCHCLLCDQKERACTIIGCKSTLKGTVRLAAHLENHKKHAQRVRAREERARNERAKPAGIDFVAALIGDPDRAARLDLRALRDFEKRLLNGKARSSMRMGSTRNALTSVQQDVNGVTVIATRIPNATASVVYRLALLGGVSPRAVVAALLAWGIDKFAEDTRTARAASAPHVSRALTAPAPKGRSMFPSSEEIE